MGILDDLLGTNTNADKNQATIAANAAAQQTGAQNQSTLQNYTSLADQVRQQYATDASNVLNSTTGQAQGALAAGGAQAQGQLAAGTNAAVGTATGSNAAYAPYIANGTAANGLYADSLGLNGAAGNAAATGAFQAGPGYQYQVDQATDAAARKAASLGMAASGNTLSAITTLGSNLANQEYGNWQANLSGLGNTGLTAANAVSSNNNTAAGFQNTGGIYGATLAQQLGTATAGTDTSLGTQQASLMSGLGGSIATDQTGLGNSLVANNNNVLSTVNSNNLSDASSADAAANANAGILSKLAGGVLNTGLSALKL